MCARKTDESVRGVLLNLIDEAYDKSAWHGPNLRGSVRQVKASEAAWRPGRGRRCIAEITAHCAYWKYAVRRRILGGKRGSFPLKGSNWFELPEPLTQRQWRDCVALLDDMHAALRKTVASCTLTRLSAARSRSGPAAQTVYGVAMHDVYHAGQIRTIKVLYKQRVKKARGT